MLRRGDAGSARVLRGRVALGGKVIRAVAVASALAALIGPADANAFRTFADDPEVAYPARWTATPIEWHLSLDEIDGTRGAEALEATAIAALDTRDRADELGHRLLQAGLELDREAQRAGDRVVDLCGAPVNLAGRHEVQVRLAGCPLGGPAATMRSQSEDDGRGEEVCS